jgi:hypothetical protein
MLCNLYMDARNLENLPLLASLKWLLAQPVPASTACGPMNHDVVGSSRTLECRSLVPGLAPGLALALLTLWIGSPRRPIAGGRLAAVVAVSMQEILQLLYLLREGFYQSSQFPQLRLMEVLQVLDKGDNGIGPGSIRRKDLLARYPPVTGCCSLSHG